MTDEDVIKALQESIIQVVASSTKPQFPIKFINVTFNKPDDDKWLELIHIPNNPSDTCWGDEKVYRGIFRFILHWPNNGGGSYDAYRYAEELAKKYVKGQRIGGLLQLQNSARIITVDDQSGELLIPVSLQYSAFSP